MSDVYIINTIKMIICVNEEFIQQIFYVPLNFRKGLKARNIEEIMNPLNPNSQTICKWIWNV